MNTPFSVVQPNNLVSNTEFQTKVDTLENCGAQMTSSGTGGITIVKSGGAKSWFQDANEVHVIAYGDNPPTKIERIGTGGGFGFQVNKSGYYELYGAFRYLHDNRITRCVIKFEFEDSDGNAIVLSLPNDRSTVAGKWIPTTTVGGSYSIARNQDDTSCCIKLNKGDCAYFMGSPVLDDISSYERQLFFGIKYICSNPEVVI